MDLSLSEVVLAIIVSGLTGVASTALTVAALRVHVIYIRESIERLDQSVTRAHYRIDQIEQNCFMTHITHPHQPSKMEHT